MNGQVRPTKTRLGNFVGCQRVWIKNHDTPGLAMSRSMGDTLAHTVGVINDPSVTVQKLKPNKNEHLIISASDGLWDMVSLQRISEVVEQVFKKQLSLGEACDTLAKEAHKLWLSKDSGKFADDTTVQVIHF